MQFIKSSEFSVPNFFYRGPILENIYIHGLQYIPVEVIQKKIPVIKGQSIEPKAFSNLVRNIYSSGYFSDVSVNYESIEGETRKVNLHINVKEKHRISDISITGNNNFSRENLEKKLTLSKILWIDHESAMSLCKKIEKLYKEKNYYKATVNFELTPLQNGTVNLIIKINEGVSGKIKKIEFTGNKKISKFKLKENIAAKEHWLLGFFDGSGSYRKEIITYDKFQIENFYHNNGFYEAYINKAFVASDKDEKIEITYDVYEGPIYKFGEIVLPENSSIQYFELKNLISAKKNDLYSKEKIRLDINAIKEKLGETGFMYPSIYPKIKINRKNKTIDLDYVIENGKPIYVRKINIKGNTKTSEDVIRREILFNEGDLLTTRKLNDSKRAVEGLGYFAPGTGVSWNMKTIDVYQADLDLLLTEVKTGKFYLQLGVNSGSDGGKSLMSEGSYRWYDSLFDGSKVSLTLQNFNFKGQGVRYYLNGSYANVDKSINCGLSTNWFLNLPLSAGVNASYRGIRYEDFRQSTEVPNERNKSGNLQFGFRSHKLNMTLFGLSSGIDIISYTNPIIPRIQFPDNPSYQLAFSEIVLRSFQPGTITWATISISNDKRNHPVRPTQGYQWIYDLKCAMPLISSPNSYDYGFIKTGIDLRWYTPLIMKYDTILHCHFYGGFIQKFPGCNVPYKELFHVGGPQSVRGFHFGQIGPSLLGSSVGSSKAFFTNIEIQTPINKNATMIGTLFYDGGAGWDTIFNNKIITEQTSPIQNFIDIFDYTPPESLIQNNQFRYRHCVGFGLALTAPMPIKIDWGFKLDRNRRIGESAYEVHISMEGSY